MSSEKNVRRHASLIPSRKFIFRFVFRLLKGDLPRIGMVDVTFSPSSTKFGTTVTAPPVAPLAMRISQLFGTSRTWDAADDVLA